MDSIELFDLLIKELKKKDDRTSLFRCKDCGEECTLIATDIPVGCPLQLESEGQFDCDWKEVE